METLNREHLRVELQKKFVEYKTYFHRKLGNTVISIDESPKERNLAAYNHDYNTIKIHPEVISGIHESINQGAPQKGQKLVIFDSLLHEMIHKYCCKFLGVTKGVDPDHGPRFKNQCNKIAKRLGLVVTNQEKYNRFPLETRHANFYKGAMNSQEEQEEKCATRILYELYKEKSIDKGFSDFTPGKKYLADLGFEGFELAIKDLL